MRRPEDLAGLDGIILPGGESTTMSMLLESSGLADPLGKELAAGLPALGTCAGMILLGTVAVDGRADQRCYGAIDITVRRNGFGRQLESFECDLDVPALGRRAVARRVHPGPAGRDERSGRRGARHVGADGRGAGGPGAPSPATAGRSPVLCRQGPVLVAAFHPELTADRRVHQLFVSMIEGTEENREGR